MKSRTRTAGVNCAAAFLTLALTCAAAVAAPSEEANAVPMQSKKAAAGAGIPAVNPYIISESQVSELYADKFENIVDITKIPEAVKQFLRDHGNERLLTMANPGEPFIGGCFADPGEVKLPHARMDLALASPDNFVMVYETGGMELSINVLFFKVINGKATLKYAGYPDGSGRQYFRSNLEGLRKLVLNHDLFNDTAATYDSLQGSITPKAPPSGLK